MPRDSSPKKQESRHCKKLFFISLRRWFPKTREGHTLRHKRVKTFDAGGVPSTLGQARNNPLQFARSDSLQEEEEGVADSSEADRDAMEARGDS